MSETRGEVGKRKGDKGKISDSKKSRYINMK
jgi:hypothetical protein